MMISPHYNHPNHPIIMASDLNCGTWLSLHKIIPVVVIWSADVAFVKGCGSTWEKYEGASEKNECCFISISYVKLRSFSKENGSEKSSTQIHKDNWLVTGLINSESCKESWN